MNQRVETLKDGSWKISINLANPQIDEREKGERNESGDITANFMEIKWVIRAYDEQLYNKLNNLD